MHVKLGSRCERRIFLVVKGYSFCELRQLACVCRIAERGQNYSVNVGQLAEKDKVPPNALS